MRLDIHPIAKTQTIARARLDEPTGARALQAIVKERICQSAEERDEIAAYGLIYYVSATETHLQLGCSGSEVLTISMGSLEASLGIQQKMVETIRGTWLSLSGPMFDFWFTPDTQPRKDHRTSEDDDAFAFYLRDLIAPQRSDIPVEEDLRLDPGFILPE